MKNSHAFVIAGTHSGVGKTSTTLGILRALTRRGVKVQPFKVGPDFIDPGHHRRAAGQASRNLDGWMLSRETNLHIFSKHSATADVSVIEGVMGLFDGYDGKTESGSTAELAKWIGAPVVLVLDAWALARSAAAMISGYKNFDPGLNVAGVIFNKVGGPEHLQWLHQAVGEDCGVKIIGGIPKTKEVEVPERHLGLFMSYEDRMSESYIERLADLAERNLDFEALLSIASGQGRATGSCPRLGRAAPLHSRSRRPTRPVRLAVARDAAFCFYYEDNFDLLKEAGAELVEFSPLSDRTLPSGVRGLYFGGGYPELHAEQLAENQSLLREVRRFSQDGGVIYGECGGLMYLSRGIEDHSGRRFPLCGIFPFWTRMSPRLKLAYAEVHISKQCALFPPQEQIRGHLFHFSEIIETAETDCVYQVRTFSDRFPEGFQVKNTLASYLHLHFAGNLEFPARLIEAAGGHLP